MTQLGGSLRFVQLSAITQLFAELGSTGRLCVTHADWTGEIVVRDGQIVAARLGVEHGRAALESIAVALSDGEFSFIDEPVAETGEALVATGERDAYLRGLSFEQQRLANRIPSMKLVPRLVETPHDDAPDTMAADSPVTIGAAAWQLIPALVFGHTLEQLARQRGVARTLREVADLMEVGLVKLDPAGVPLVRVQPVAARPVGPRPVALRAVATAEESNPPTPVAGHQVNGRLSFARRFSASAAVQPEEQPQRQRVAPLKRADAPPIALVRVAERAVDVEPQPVMPPRVAARLAAASQFVPQPVPSAASTPPQPTHSAWRRTIVDFFLHPEPTLERDPSYTDTSDFNKASEGIAAPSGS